MGHEEERPGQGEAGHGQIAFLFFLSEVVIESGPRIVLATRIAQNRAGFDEPIVGVDGVLAAPGNRKTKARTGPFCVTENFEAKFPTGQSRDGRNGTSRKAFDDFGVECICITKATSTARRIGGTQQFQVRNHDRVAHSRLRFAPLGCPFTRDVGAFAWHRKSIFGPGHRARGRSIRGDNGIPERGRGHGNSGG